jgi:hypothetical protein
MIRLLHLDITKTNMPQEKVQYLHRYDHTHGMNDSVSPFMMTEKSSTVLNGCTPNEILGGLVKDVGYDQSGDAGSGKSILGAFDFVQDPSTKKFLITQNDSTDTDTELRYLNGAVFTEIPAAQAAWGGHTEVNVDMETFIGHCFIVGHGTAGYLPVGSLTGTTFSTSANVTDMPQAKFVEVYKYKVWTINCRDGGTDYPGRVYKSSTPTAGAITWDDEWEDIDLQYALTGSHVIWDKILFFTEHKTYYTDENITGTLFTNAGCVAHRTILSKDDILYFGGRDGYYMSVGAGRPQKISGSIKRFYMAGDPSTYFAERVDNQIYLHMGTITVRDRVYSNLQAVYNLDTQMWYVRELGRHNDASTQHTMTIYAKYLDSSTGDDRLYMGTDKGKIYNKSKHTDSTIITSDDDLPIYSSFELAPFLTRPDKKKRAVEMVSFARQGNGLRMFLRKKDDKSDLLTDYEFLGELTKYENAFSTFSTSGSILELKGEEVGSNEPWEYYGTSIGLKLDGNPTKNAANS